MNTVHIPSRTWTKIGDSVVAINLRLPPINESNFFWTTQPVGDPEPADPTGGGGQRPTAGEIFTSPVDVWLWCTTTVSVFVQDVKSAQQIVPDAPVIGILTQADSYPHNGIKDYYGVAAINRSAVPLVMTIGDPGVVVTLQQYETYTATFYPFRRVIASGSTQFSIELRGK